MAERDIQQAIREALGLEPDLVLWRNSTGYTEEFSDRTMQSRGIRYGLGKGSADLVGIGPGGRFFALETKSPSGRLTPEQVKWANLVRRFGGFCATVRSVDEAKAALVRARAGASE
jgi:hypothetical protein